MNKAATITKPQIHFALFFCILLLNSLSYAKEQDRHFIAWPDKSPLLRALTTPVIPENFIDGRTFTGKNGKIYRLMSLNYPFGEERAPSDIEIEAQSYLSDWLIGQPLKLFVLKGPNPRKQNRYGHMLVHAVLANQQPNEDYWVQGSLVRNGFARLFFNAQQNALHDRLLDLEAQAQSENLGLWQNAAYKIKDLQTLKDDLFKFTIIEAKIEKVARTKSMTYLNFGSDWKSDFTVGITNDLRRKFVKNNIDLSQLVDKTIKIRGYLRFYNGPYIELDTPEHLEIK